MELKSQNTIDHGSNGEPNRDSDIDTVEYPSAFWAACVSVGVALGLFLVFTVTLAVNSKY
jgi:hypothetical protein